MPCLLSFHWSNQLDRPTVRPTVRQSNADDSIAKVMACAASHAHNPSSCRCCSASALFSAPTQALTGIKSAQRGCLSKRQSWRQLGNPSKCSLPSSLPASSSPSGSPSLPHPLLVHLIYHNLHVSHALLYMNCMQFISICIIYYFAQTQRPKLFLSGWPNLLLGPCSATTTTTTSRVQLISMATWSTTIIIKEMLNKANSTGPIPCNEDWVMTQVFST